MNLKSAGRYHTPGDENKMTFGTVIPNSFTRWKPGKNFCKKLMRLHTRKNWMVFNLGIMPVTGGIILKALWQWKRFFVTRWVSKPVLVEQTG